MFRRQNHTNLEEVATFVQTEVISSEQLEGYQCIDRLHKIKGYILYHKTEKIDQVF